MDMSSKRVLLLDADQERSSQLKTILEFLLCSVYQPRSISFEVDIFKQQGPFDLVCIGDGMPDLSTVTGNLHRWEASLPIVLLINTGAERDVPMTVKSGVAAIQTWPTNYPEWVALLRTLEGRKAVNKPAHRRSIDLFRSLTGSSQRIREACRLIGQVADADATVLVLGESGTGKEVVARNLHYRSSRRDKAFVPMNCGAIPGELLESELFGHEKGAFTGAFNARQGRFELAEGGTLFLDEIGDMPLSMQVKILRVLQEQTFERVGSNRMIECNVRIIAATHRNLEEEITQGRFREDLFYRLNVFPIRIPALRDRAEDIPDLVADLIAKMQQQKRKPISLTRLTLNVLMKYNWPGNVRELANLIERLGILYPGKEIDAEDLPEKFRRSMIVKDDVQSFDERSAVDIIPSKPRLPDTGMNLKQYLIDTECELIRQALTECKGVVKHAAEHLQIRRTTLIEKMRKYNIHRSLKPTV